MSNKQSVQNASEQSITEQVPIQSENVGNASCGGYFLHKILKISKLANNATTLLNKTLSKSRSRSPATPTSPSPNPNPSESPENITIQMGSAYLRRIDFSTVEPISIKCDNSAYFDDLFSPQPQLTELPTPITTAQRELDFNQIVSGKNNNIPKISGKKTVYSKSASQIL